MREQLLNNFLSSIEGLVDSNTLQQIQRNLILELNNYDVSKRATDVVPYNYIPDCVKVYLTVRKIEGIKTSTLKLYALRLKQFFDMTRIPIECITSNDIYIWLYKLQNQQGNRRGILISNRTLDNARQIICTFFKWANSQGYIDKNPCVTIRPIKYNKRERKSLSEEELELIRSACETPRDIAIIEVLYSTGCRVSELTNIKITDINFDKDEILLFGKGEKYRYSYLNAKAKLAIKRYLNTRCDELPYLFISRQKKQLSKNSVEHIVKTLGLKSGIERRIYPHLIRHTTATLGLQRGMDVTDVQRMLGHASLDTTMIYAHVANSTVKSHHKNCIV